LRLHVILFSDVSNTNSFDIVVYNSSINSLHQEEML
jgi:hypothetical protein